MDSHEEFLEHIARELASLLPEEDLRLLTDVTNRHYLPAIQEQLDHSKLLFNRIRNGP